MYSINSVSHLIFLQPLQELVKPHIESFNYVLSEGLHLVTASISPIEFEVATGDRITLTFTVSCTISKSVSSWAKLRLSKEIQMYVLILTALVC